MIHFVFIVVALLSLNLEAHAERNFCDQLLSATDLSSPDAAAISYVNLVQYYIQNVDRELSDRVVNKLLNSSSFINPFLEEDDSLSIQVSDAIDTLEKSIKAKDWKLVKKSIQALSEKSQAETKDRDEKEEETSVIFNLKVSDKKYAKDIINSSPAWQVVNGRAFFVIGSNDDLLRLYELVNGKLVEKGSYKTNDGIVGSASWQVVKDSATGKDRIFVAFGSYDTHLYLYEFVDDHLEPRGSQETKKAVRSTPAWQVVGDKVYLAVGSDDRNLYLFELVDGRLESRGHTGTEGLIASSPAWQVVGDKVYLAVGSYDKHLYFYELVDGHLKQRGKLETDNYILSSPVWQVVGDKIYVAFGSNDGHLYLAELVDGNLVSRGSLDAHGTVRSVPAWHVVGKRVFVAVGSFKRHLRLYELIDGQLKEITTAKTEGDIGSSPAWQVVQDRIYVTFGSYDNNLYVYELVDDELELRGSFAARDTIQSSPKWFATKDGVFIAVGSYDKTVYLFKIFEKLKK